MLISNDMTQDLGPGDFLVFQLEAGFAMLRVLAVDNSEDDVVWHVAAYRDFFPDVDAAETAAKNDTLVIGSAHLALTSRAFESTQVARVARRELTENELAPVGHWRRSDGKVSDRSVRLLLGLR
jgi:hypothetical protein